jgi:hypothetical protein
MSDATTIRAARLALDALCDAAISYRDESDPDDVPVTHDAAAALAVCCERALARLCEPEPEAEKGCGDWKCPAAHVEDPEMAAKVKARCSDFPECDCDNCGQPFSAHVASRTQPEPALPVPPDKGWEIRSRAAGLLPVPGEGGCPEWARWIAWSPLGTAIAYSAGDEPYRASDGQLMNPGRRSAILDAFDSPSRAGQCVKLPEACVRFICLFRDASWHSAAICHAHAEQHKHPCINCGLPHGGSINAAAQSGTDLVSVGDVASVDQAKAVGGRTTSRQADYGGRSHAASLGGEVQNFGAAEDAIAQPTTPEPAKEAEPVMRTSGGPPLVEHGRWQCSGCRLVFRMKWRRECPNCHRFDYWSGSVDPAALEWDSGGDALRIGPGTFPDQFAPTDEDWNRYADKLERRIAALRNVLREQRA